MQPSDFRIDAHYGGEWRADLPPQFGTFFGRPLSVEMSRWRPDQRKQPSEADIKLLNSILPELPKILEKAKREFEKFEPDAPEFIEHLTTPYIWISENLDKHPDDWTLVLERTDWPDYGCHIEFRGCEFVKIWAGD